MLRVDDRSRRALASLQRPQRSLRMAFCAFSTERSNGLGSARASQRRSLVFAFQPGLTDEFAGESHRAEALIVKVIGQAIPGNGLQSSRGQGGSFLIQIAHHNQKPIAPEVLGAVRVRQVSQRLELEAALAQGVGGSVLDGQVLDGLRVAVLETSVADAMARQIPAPADGLDGLDRSQPALCQAIKGVASLAGWLDRGQLLNLEILGCAFELHERREPMDW